jgi:hypothetical protein
MKDDLVFGLFVFGLLVVACGIALAGAGLLVFLGGVPA